MSGVPSDQRETTIINSRHTYEVTFMYGYTLISGYLGVFAHSSFLSFVKSKFDVNLPDYCKRIDDDLVSVYARDGGYKVVTAPFGLDFDHFASELAGNHDGLTWSYDRMLDRHRTHLMINRKYMDNITIAMAVSIGLAAVFFIVTIVLSFLLALR